MQMRKKILDAAKAAWLNSCAGGKVAVSGETPPAFFKAKIEER